MAVWQYQLNVIPKKAVLEKYGELPVKLFIDFDGWKEYWNNRRSQEGFSKPQFEDARTIKWWEKTKLDTKKVAEQIDLLVKRGDWSNDDSGFIGWKGNSNQDEDNDAHISYNTKTNIISEFQFRTDLRNKENLTKFLKGILNICRENELVVFNVEGHLFEPDFDIVFDDLKKSNALAFLADPIKFFDTIAEKNDDSKPQKEFFVKNENQLKGNSLWSTIKSLFK